VALSDAQKASIRRYLGYSDISRGSPTPLESALDALSSEAETLVGDILTKLASIETQLEAAWSQASVSRVEDVWFAGASGVQHLRQEARRLVRDLGNILGVPPRGTPFSSGSQSGPTYRG